MRDTRVAVFIVAFVVTTAANAELAISASEVDLSAFSGRLSVCPENSSAVGNTCRCVAGFYRSGSACAPCSAGTYSDRVADEPCANCASGSHSLPGAMSEKECMCNPGYERRDDACQQCPLGAYKSFYSNVRPCTPCHNFSNTSATGATTRLQCLCEPGFGVGSASCVACALNTAKAMQNNSACQDCVLDTYTAISASVKCLACFENSGRPVDTEVCQCNAGFQKTPGNDSCVACTEGYFCEGEDKVRICSASLGPGSSSAASAKSSTDCFCNAGYYLEETRCKKCRVNTYCPKASINQTNCPQNTHSAAGSPSIEDCICNPGYTT